MDEYVILAWSLASFIGGAVAGGMAVYKLAVTPMQPKSRPGHTWARNDVRAAEAQIAVDRFIPKESWVGGGVTDGRTVSFSILDSLGMQRDMTYTAATLLKFFKCDTPTRREWRGDNTEYSRLIAVGTYYKWITREGAGYAWAAFLSTRERRLKVLECWISS